MTEAFLHYCWKHRLLANEIYTVDNQKIAVISVGEVNNDAGPDFFNSKLMIGDTEWAGNVEIHLRSSDWNQHGHSADKRYNNVILHVVYENDAEVVLENGRRPATLELKNQLRPGVWENYCSLQRPSVDDTIPCSNVLSQIPDFTIKSYLERLAVERLEQKSEVVKRLLTESGNSWETCCYWAVARFFGGKVNAMPFELLAKSIDMRVFAKIKQSAFRIEALLFGQAGMLDVDFSDDYPNALKKEYEYQRKVYNLSPIEGYLWKFFRVRPSGFPTIRISQFADFIFKSNGLFSKLLETTDVDTLLSFFDVSASEYWQTHYHFDKPVKSKSKALGTDFAESIVINAWAPTLMLYGIEYQQQIFKDNALQILASLPCENNAIIKKWSAAGLNPENALHSQALIQLYNEYCRKKRCLSCQIGYKVLIANA